jgi:hypothetical protein
VEQEQEQAEQEQAELEPAALGRAARDRAALEPAERLAEAARPQHLAQPLILLTYARQIKIKR